MIIDYKELLGEYLNNLGEDFTKRERKMFNKLQQWDDVDKNVA